MNEPYRSGVARPKFKIFRHTITYEDQRGKAASDLDRASEEGFDVLTSRVDDTGNILVTVMVRR